MKKLGYLETYYLSDTDKEQLQKCLKGFAVCLVTPSKFRAFGEIDESLNPDYDLGKYKEDPYFELLRKQYILMEFILNEYYNKYGGSYTTFEDIEDYFNSIDDLRALDECSLEEINKMELERLKKVFSKIR